MNIDHETLQPDGSIEDVSRIRPLHPTLRKCKCGYIDTSYKVTEHIWSLMKQARDTSEAAPNSFWQFHGEVPLNEGDV